jgi:hypothetical protein
MSMNTLYKHKHAILLTMIVCVAFVQSFSHRLVLGQLAFDVASSTTELFVFMIVFERRASRLLALIVLAIALAVTWVHYVLPPSYSRAPLRLIHHSALLLLLGFATIVILHNIFKRTGVRSDDVLGAVCGYLLAAAAWSHLFLLIEIFVPGSFSVGPGFTAQLNTWHGRIALVNYASLGFLTTVGAGEIVPVRPPTTILATLEAVFGQFYIAVVVAQLVGARLSQIAQGNPQT